MESIAMKINNFRPKMIRNNKNNRIIIKSKLRVIIIN